MTPETRLIVASNLTIAAFIRKNQTAPDPLKSFTTEEEVLNTFSEIYDLLLKENKF
ncbi:MAG: hypothetical protein ACLQBQ_09600 [Smithella sp.]